MKTQPAQPWHGVLLAGVYFFVNDGKNSQGELSQNKL
jgi:hypothetical protein